MIVAKVESKKQTPAFYGRLNSAMDFIRNARPEKMADGRYELSDGMYCLVQRYHSRRDSEVRYEMHKKYADIQYIVSGRERLLQTFGPLAEAEPFREDADIGAYEDGEAENITYLCAGEFVLYLPGEYHKPSLCFDGVNTDEVVKLVVKIPME